MPLSKVHIAGAERKVAVKGLTGLISGVKAVAMLLLVAVGAVVVAATIAVMAAVWLIASVFNFVAQAMYGLVQLLGEAGLAGLSALKKGVDKVAG